MADMVRKGATLTGLSCPVCSSPLLKTRSGNMYCVHCQKRVMVVKQGMPVTEVTSPMVLNNLEITILTKLQELENWIEKEKDFENLRRLFETLSMLIETLEKIRKIKGN
jgi:uncharacterized Zn finger protein (UPF0148 family)